MKTSSAVRSLYLCYFGLREPLVQTQVLPYLRQLRIGGIEVRLLTFEHEAHGCARKELRAERARLAREGIQWIYLPYHKHPSPLAKLYDVAAGARLASWLIRRQGIHIVHARSHVAAAMGAVAKRVSGGCLIFDIRGFMPEEYTDAGIWPANGYLYRWTKTIERHLVAAADGFVVLTEQARDILFPGRVDIDQLGRPIEVIPCCVDLERFRAAGLIAREELRRELGIAGRRVLVYVGALGGWYLTEEMAELIAVAYQQNRATFAMILTQSPPELIAEPLRRRGMIAADCFVRRVMPAEIPRYLRAADLAISLIKPCYSKLSSSPTKLAEYLASGLPVICNAGIGDVDDVIEADRVGVLLREFNREAYGRALTEAEILRQDSDTQARCRISARDRFDLEKVGGARYRRLYHRLLMRQRGPLAATVPTP